MRKYNVRTCNCGRIHMIPNEKVERALEDDKNFLLVCAGCGAATLIGADIQPDWDEPDKNYYMMYSGDFSRQQDASINISDFNTTANSKGIKEIFYSHGVKVPMMTGHYATDCFNGRFSDGWFPDFYEIQRKDVTVEEIMKFIDEYNNKSTTVNMQRFINETPDDILEEISCYLINGLHWEGTKFEKCL